MDVLRVVEYFVLAGRVRVAWESLSSRISVRDFDVASRARMYDVDSMHYAREVSISAVSQKLWRPC